MRRYFEKALLALAIFFPVTILAEDPALKVGFIAALSGPVQAYGEAARNGFEMALSESGEQSISVVYEDDQFVPAKTIAAFNKLTHVNSVDMVICVGSATCNAVAPIAESKRIPLVGWASDSQASKGWKYYIRSFPSGDDEGKRAGEEAVKRGSSNFAIVYATHDYPIAWHRGVRAVIPEASLVLDEQVPPDMHDFKSLLLKARQKGVENFVVCIMSGQVGIFAKQSHEMGLKAKIGGCEFLEDENEAKIANGALNGAWYIVLPITPDFATKYKQKYGTENAITGAAIHYDLFNLLARLAKEKRTENLVKNLLSIGKYSGAAGPMTMKNINGDQFFDYELVAKEVAAH